MTLEELGAAERSNIRLMIYFKACEVLSAGNYEQRKIAFRKVPKAIRAEVRKEYERLYQLRGLE